MRDHHGRGSSEGRENGFHSMERKEQADHRGGKRYFGRGGIRWALLKLLAIEPMHGYQMMKALEEQSGGVYVPSAGSIYPTLQLLEDHGLVSAREESGKKIYHLTIEGRAELATLPERGHRGPRLGEPLDPEREAFRRERVKGKLGISDASYDVLQLLVRAEQHASADKARTAVHRQLMADIHKQLLAYVEAVEMEPSPPASNEDA
ncbi:PadR family transcriptional regulator [Paenibacillus sp. y28]|uniref:PadR family transcriptional regulator n=1 Tax=Paenibacillus sp. y28 TaxID=3129110 RepID=UPI0030175F78